MRLRDACGIMCGTVAAREDRKKMEQQLRDDPTGNVAFTIFNDLLDGEGSFAEWKLYEWAEESDAETYKLVTEDDIRETAITALEQYDFRKAREILKRWDRKPVGRQPKVRGAAVKALIYKTYLGWSWPKLSDKFCTCGKPHTRSCQESLRSRVTQLRRELRKHGVKDLS